MSIDDKDPLSALIADCYDAATEGDALWSRFIPKVASSLGSIAGVLHVVDVSSGSSEMLGRVGYTDAMIAEYVSHWVPKDLWIDVCLPKLGQVVATDRLIADSDFLNSEIYNDFFRRNLGVFWSAGAMFELQDGRLGTISFQRRRDQGVYSDEDLMRLSPLLPHLRRALNLRSKLIQRDGAAELGFAALDALDCGVAIVDRSARVRFANATLRSIAARADGLQVSRLGGRLEATWQTDKTILDRLIASSTSDQILAQAGGSMQIHRPNDLPAWLALVAPFRPGAKTLRHGEPCLALVMIEDRESKRPHLAAQFRGMFGLTAAEAELAVALSQGERLEDICDQRGVAIATGRSQIRAIFAKTNTDRQSSLMRLAMSLPRLRPTSFRES